MSSPSTSRCGHGGVAPADANGKEIQPFGVLVVNKLQKRVNSPLTAFARFGQKYQKWLKNIIKTIIK